MSQRRFCQKDYSITVGSGSPPIAYYKFETDSGGIYVDSIGSSNITANDGGGKPTIVPGFIGNGIQCLVATDATESQAQNWLIPNLTSHDQTYRYWFKITQDNPLHSEIYMISPFVEMDTYFIGSVLTVYIYITGNPSQSQQYFSVNLNSISDSTWHWIALTLDYSGLLCNVWLDSVLVISQAITLTPPYLVPKNTITDQSLFIYMDATAAGMVTMFDEFGVWDRVLSMAELTADWNNGAGKTYP